MESESEENMNATWKLATCTEGTYMISRSSDYPWIAEWKLMMVFDWGKVSVVKRRHVLATAARQPRVQAKGGSGMGPTEARTQTRSLGCC